MKNILDQLTNLDEKQLIELNGAIRGHIKFLRAAKTQSMRSQLKEGDKVSWAGKKGIQTGVVTEVKRKYAHVSTNSQNWRVPMSMLKVV